MKRKSFYVCSLAAALTLGLTPAAAFASQAGIYSFPGGKAIVVGGCGIEDLQSALKQLTGGGNLGGGSFGCPGTGIPDLNIPGLQFPNISDRNPGSGGSWGGSNPGSGGNWGGNNPGSGGNWGGNNPGSGEDPESENNSGGSTTQDAYAAQVVELVNQERQKAGLKALTVNVQAERAAEIRAREIETSFSHTRPNGTDFFTVLRETGVSYQSAGENIAYGQKTPTQVMNSWMNSSGHRANILGSNYTSIAVCHYKSSAGVDYWEQLFLR